MGDFTVCTPGHCRQPSGAQSAGIVQRLDDLMRRAREDGHRITYQDLLEVRSSGVEVVPTDTHAPPVGAQPVTKGEPTWWAAALNRRTTVEQWMLDAARGKRPMPTAEELRAWAIKLGTPTEGEPQPACEARQPDGYAYEYPEPFGGIRFTNGEERNGHKPTRAVPYWLGAGPGDRVNLTSQAQGH